MSRIPLLPYPLALLKKYERDAVVRTAGKLLPVSSNQKMNAYLKEIADLCNIPKNLTTHVAKHTFACLAVEYGMPIDCDRIWMTEIELTKLFGVIVPTIRAAIKGSVFCQHRLTARCVSSNSIPFE